MIKMIIKGFEGEHIIFKDKRTESHINVRAIRMIDLFKNKNDTLICSDFENPNLGGLENKMDMIMYRRKDSYVSSKYLLKKLELIRNGML